MPAPIPDRYRLEVRLGRDGDLEEWLATDTSLDRPVLIRSLGPESVKERRRAFVASVSGAAKASHPHLARVYSVSEVEGGAYSVSEWTGGATLADRVDASRPIELPDFLPNATGLADALAALHDQDVAHGAIDLGAISYSGAHAAKLGAFGRIPRSDIQGDVRALAAALETALTGSAPGGPPPSERIDGVSTALDSVLRAGQSGKYAAAGFREALGAAPTPREPQPQSRATSLRLLFAAVGLVVIAGGLVALGRVVIGGGPPILPPPRTDPTTSVTTEVAATIPRTTLPGAVGITEARTYDPYGEGGENDDLVANLLDGDTWTGWRTERYQSALGALKPGVGVAFAVIGSPSRIELLGLTRGTEFGIYWSAQLPDVIEDWSRVAGGTAPPGDITLSLPQRESGFWLLWLTDLPEQQDGSRLANMAEVRFRP
ncbi:MAG: protein kinase [Acidimicrobiia bacterium]